jgi:hypothetical protein
LLKIGAAQFDDELLLTLMTEVTATVNSRPIATVSADIDEPIPLSPSMLLSLHHQAYLSGKICMLESAGEESNILPTNSGCVGKGSIYKTFSQDPSGMREKGIWLMETWC